MDKNAKIINLRAKIEQAMKQKRPVVQDAIPDAISDKLKTIYEVLQEFLPPTFEQFEREFLRDPNIDSEATRWSIMAVVFDKYIEEHPLASPDERRHVLTYSTLLAAGMAIGSTNPTTAPDSTWVETQRIWSNLFPSSIT